MHVLLLLTHLLLKVLPPLEKWDGIKCEAIVVGLQPVLEVEDVRRVLGNSRKVWGESFRCCNSAALECTPRPSASFPFLHVRVCVSYVWRIAAILYLPRAVNSTLAISSVKPSAFAECM